MDTATKIANRIGVTDLFALHRVSEQQLINLAGVGRGAGWAGNVSIDPEDETLIAAALSGNGVVRHSGASSCIFGPYWAREAALMLVGDFVVVFGDARGDSGLSAQTDDELVAAAEVSRTCASSSLHPSATKRRGCSPTRSPQPRQRSASR